MAASIALAHHEKWDGTGYPRQLAGEAIPVEARIVAIADTFDLLSSKQPSKNAYTDEQVLEIIRGAVGNHFQPAVHDAFLEALPEIRSIKKRFADGVEVAPLSKWAWLEETLCG